MSRIKLEDGNTEFWKRRFLGETRNHLCEEVSNEEDQELDDELDDDEEEEDDDDDDSTKEPEEEIDDEEAVEPTESQAGDETKGKSIKGPIQHLQMIGVQLLKDLEKTPVSSKKKRMPEVWNLCLILIGLLIATASPFLLVYHNLNGDPNKMQNYVGSFLPCSHRLIG